MLTKARHWAISYAQHPHQTVFLKRFVQYYPHIQTFPEIFSEVSRPKFYIFMSVSRELTSLSLGLITPIILGKDYKLYFFSSRNFLLLPFISSSIGSEKLLMKYRTY